MSVSALRYVPASTVSVQVEQMLPQFFFDPAAVTKIIDKLGYLMPVNSIIPTSLLDETSSKDLKPSPNPCNNTAVFLTTNENGVEKAYERLAASPLKGGCHCGVGGFDNYDMMLVMESSGDVLFDFNPTTCLMHRWVKEIILEANTPDEFVYLFSLAIEKYQIKIDLGLDRVVSKNMCWLQRQDLYDKN
jgi:hypothetical protein